MEKLAKIAMGAATAGAAFLLASNIYFEYFKSTGFYVEKVFRQNGRVMVVAKNDRKVHPNYWVQPFCDQMSVSNGMHFAWVNPKHNGEPIEGFRGRSDEGEDIGVEAYRFDVKKSVNALGH